MSNPYYTPSGTPGTKTGVNSAPIRTEFAALGTAFDGVHAKLWAKDGTTTVTANIPMGGFRHTGVADAVTSGQYLAFGQSGAQLQGNVTINPPSSGDALTVVGGNNQIKARPATETGFGIITVANASSVRKLEFVYAGTGSAGAYGMSAGSVGINASAGSSLSLGAGDTVRQIISAAGNVTINAPSSGVGLTQTGAAGSDAVVFNGGTSGSFRVTERGLPYGTALHNNAGPLTGTTNQYIASGTWTPTFANIVNTSTYVLENAFFSRLGNKVDGCINLYVRNTAASSGCAFTFTLPIACASFPELGGVCAMAQTEILGQSSLAYGSSNTLGTAEFVSGTTNNIDRYVTIMFSYLVN
jgi:hypothetical protein